MENNLFKEFDVAAISFLNDHSLTRLLSAGLINENVMAISQEVRKVWIELQNDNWTIAEARNDQHWKYLFSLCDELLKLLLSMESQGILEIEDIPEI